MRRRGFLGLAAGSALSAAGCKTYKSDDVPPPVVSHPPATPAAPQAVTRGGGPVPFTRGKVMLGGYVDLQGLSTAAGLSRRRRQLGRDERIIHRYYSWTDPLPVTRCRYPCRTCPRTAPSCCPGAARTTRRSTTGPRTG
jgi:hypothetical protein